MPGSGHSEEPEARAFLLSLWRERAGGPWRAALRPARGGARLGFADLDQLAAYLLGLDEAPLPRGPLSRGDPKPPDGILSHDSSARGPARAMAMPMKATGRGMDEQWGQVQGRHGQAGGGTGDGGGRRSGRRPRDGPRQG